MIGKGFHHLQCSGLYPTPKITFSFKVCLERKKEECVKSADGMELLRRMMMAYGGMFPCLILLLFHGIHSHWICGMMPSSFGMELN